METTICKAGVSDAEVMEMKMSGAMETKYMTVTSDMLGQASCPKYDPISYFHDVGRLFGFETTESMDQSTFDAITDLVLETPFFVCTRCLNNKAIKERFSHLFPKEYKK